MRPGMSITGHKGRQAHWLVPISQLSLYYNNISSGGGDTVGAATATPSAAAVWLTGWLDGKNLIQFFSDTRRVMPRNLDSAEKFDFLPVGCMDLDLLISENERIEFPPRSQAGANVAASYTL
ncbi:hypothetical protein RRG08_054816 [Elysia crispata]|uniref:Uncharacterized protein n=1 Tax=Elysia crispata TaxID=231223 RepID=A0AAE0YFP8_9GAST|nr:hypothetical protein RRG08_054816 [Elysia crispata]